MKISSAKDLGILVRDRRKSNGWTQAELAKHSGVKPLWISQFERGKTTAQVGLVFQTLKALGISLWTEDPTSQAEARHTSKNGIDLDDILANQ